VGGVSWLIIVCSGKKKSPSLGEGLLLFGPSGLVTAKAYRAASASLPA
jgi:hypothetical protein